MVRQTRRNTQKTQIIQSIKDYFVPLLGLILIIFILIKVFWGESETTDTNQAENKFWSDIVFVWENTEAYIIYTGNKKEKISETTDFFKWESIQVKEGSVKLKFPSETTIHLNKIAELKYESEGKYSFYSSDGWFNLKEESTISMKYATIEAKSSSILSLTQNEAGSTIYVLQGSAKISNLAGSSTQLSAGQKITVTRLDTSKEEMDISGDKLPIDSYFKSSDWFIENEWHLLVPQMEEEWSMSGSVMTSSGTSFSGTFISLENISDEMSINTQSINIVGTIKNPLITSITIDNKNTVIQNWKFSLIGVSLPETSNDIVLKYFDTNKNIIGKEVFTIYTSNPGKKAPETIENTSDSSNSDKPVSNTSENAVSSNIADPSKFSFTEPSTTNKYTTNGSEITIRGKTSATGIEKVQVNGFPLSSFNGSTWRYHAFTRFDTLKEGTNQYRVDYFGSDGKIVYTDYYTIVKQGSIGISSTGNTTEWALFTD